MTMITPSYLGETIEYSSLNACRSTLEDPTFQSTDLSAIENSIGPSIWNSQILPQLRNFQVNTQRINFFEPLSTFRFTVSRTF